MTKLLRLWLKGAVIAVASMALYAISLGFFLALTLLVISMEEGGDNLSQLAVPLTQTLVLLSEGIGFTAGSFTLSVTPLLLTALLVALIASITSRIGISIHAYLSGVTVWFVINWIFSQEALGEFRDPFWIIMLKAVLVFSLGYGWSALRKTHTIGNLWKWLESRTRTQLMNACRTGVYLAGILLGTYLVIGFITVLFWVGLNYRAMGNIFMYTHMQSGSRILTTICSLAWLPNICIWAVSWLFGSGFSIGDLGTFTLWVGQSHGLPPVPIFGLLPSSVHNPTLQTLFVVIPLCSGIVAGFITLLLPRVFHIRFSMRAQSDALKNTVVDMIYPFGSFCVSSVLVVVASSLLFALSNGSLGSHSLSHVGVNIAASTQTVGHGTALGLFGAWLVVAIVLACKFAFRWLQTQSTSLSLAQGEQSSGERNETISDVHTEPRVVNSAHHHKEEHHDINESADS